MSSRILTVGIATIAAGALLAGCTPPNENPSDEKVDTGASFTGTYPGESSSSSSSSTSTSTTTETSTVESTTTKVVDKDGNELDVSLSSTTLHNGENLNVKLTGLNPDLGYYAAICASDGSEVSPTPYCTGRDTDVDAQAWLRNEGGTERINEDGSAEFTITPRAQGDRVNCYEEQCAFTIFGDEFNGVGEVEAFTVPVTFAS